MRERWLPDPKLMAAMERMTVTAKNRVRGSMQGKRRSKQLGSSLEFADYRLYAPGDDIRRLDWNAYGRTGKPFIKQYMDEQELQVHLFVDVSDSMNFIGGGSEVSKLVYAARMAACIGYITLTGLDRVSAKLFSARIENELPLIRGRSAAIQLFDFFHQAAPSGKGDLASALLSSSSMPRSAGVSWVLSDFMFEKGAEDALAYLQASRQEVVAVQVLSLEELHPSLQGNRRLVDSELRTGKEAAITGRVLREYEQALRAHTERLAALCRERGMHFVQVTTNTPLEHAIGRMLLEQGLLA